jgi:hypothetical protein
MPLSPRVPMFRNLPFCECASATIALTDQGFANLSFRRGKIGPKQTQIARVVRAMDHPVAIGAEHRKVGRHIISDRHPLLQRFNRPQVMRFNKAFADFAVALFKV